MKLPSITTVSLVLLASEILLLVTRRSRAQSSGKDRFTLPLLWLVITLSIFGGFFCRAALPQFQLPHPTFFYVVGLILFVLGIVIRWVAIIQLGRFFTVNVAIAKDHELITTGLYRYLRHPSYSGTFLIFLGFGLCLLNWISLAILFIPITCAFLWRMRIEESALKEAFGERYQEYARSTARVVPLVY